MMGIPYPEEDEMLNRAIRTEGVAAALESVFKREPFAFNENSLEYAEAAHAYWRLKAEAPELFADPAIGATVVPGVVSTDVAPEASSYLTFREEAMNFHFRRILRGISTAYASFQHMAAIRAFDKDHGLFSSHSSSTVEKP